MCVVCASKFFYVCLSCVFVCMRVCLYIHMCVHTRFARVCKGSMRIIKNGKYGSGAKFVAGKYACVKKMEDSLCTTPVTSVAPVDAPLHVCDVWTQPLTRVWALACERLQVRNACTFPLTRVGAIVCERLHACNVWTRLCVLFVCLVPYFPMFFYTGFVMDDAVAVQRNPNVVNASVSLKSLLERDFWGLALFEGTWTHKSFRPLTTFTYRLNYLIHGIHSSGFHVANLFLHAIACLTVYRLAARVCPQSGPFAWLMCMALFAVHPVHTENVLYLVGRADILSTIFFRFHHCYRVQEWLESVFGNVFVDSGWRFV